MKTLIDTPCEEIETQSVSYLPYFFLPIYLAISHEVAILSDDVVVDDECIIPSTFPQQTVKQLEVIQEVYIVLSEVVI